MKPANDKDSNIFYKNTFGRDAENSFENKNFVMLQSFLHVSFPGNNYKNWLQEVLIFLKAKCPSDIPHNSNFAFDFKECLLNISRKYLDEYDGTFNNGTNTPRFLFNLLDYLLWYEFETKSIGITDKRMDGFRFSPNNSVEHLLPQSKIEEIILLDDDADFSDRSRILNHFGNLCLISQSSNSKYNDCGFEAKKEQFKKKEHIESVKQILMFNCSQWNSEEIRTHSIQMLTLIEKFKKTDPIVSIQDLQSKSLPLVLSEDFQL